MLIVFDSLLAWYRFEFLGRSRTPLNGKSSLSRELFLTIAAVA